MSWWSWSAVNVAGAVTEAFAEETCAHAANPPGHAHAKETDIRKNLVGRRTRSLQMLFLLRSRKAIYFRVHIKPSNMRPTPKNRFFLPLLMALLCSTAPVRAQRTTGSQVWVGTWAASQQIPEPQNAVSTDDLNNVTMREIFHLSMGGTTLRVHLSNAFGTEPLHFSSVHIARPLSASSAAIDPASDRALLFAGESDVIVPAGAEYVSDPIDFLVSPLSNLAVTFHFDRPPAPQTGHPGSRATSYYQSGDLVSAANLPDANRVDHWYQISGVDVLAPPGAGSVVALGDSTTDGHGATTNGNDRWTDVLAARLQNLPATRSIGVLNQGIGGNHLLIDGLGPNALARFDRDVLAQAGVRWLIVFEGVNDLGGLARNGEVPAAEHNSLVLRILAAYQQIIV